VPRSEAQILLVDLRVARCIVSSDYALLPALSAQSRQIRLLVKQAVVGCIPLLDCLLLEAKMLQPLRSRSYRFVVLWERIPCPDPKRRFILPS
jgi:hypothetical protein